MREQEQAALPTLIAAAATATDPAAHRTLATAYRQAGKELEAGIEDCAAAAIEAGQPLVIFNLATIFMNAGHKATAATWYELALLLDPGMVIARRNLASIRFDQGRREEAQAHWDRAYRQQCVLVTQAPHERRRVLLLAAAGYGNVPVKYLLPSQTNTRIEYFIEYAAPDTPLPAHDLVFNAVGDPDVEEPIFPASCNFVDTSATPWLNHPTNVSHTRRDRLPTLLHGIPDIELPPVRRVRNRAAAEAAMSETGIGFPLLLRPAASHGGDGLTRVDSAAGLRVIDPQGAGPWYLCPFRDYRSADGYWRKYRMIFVDREPYPYHLAISAHWLVHYATANMLSDPAKCADELRFLEDPAAVLGPRGMAAIRAIGHRLDLDYAGIDFTMLPDGRVLVFEANATMLVHPEPAGPFAYKNRFVDRILSAFETLLTSRITVSQEEPLPRAA